MQITNFNSCVLLCLALLVSAFQAKIYVDPATLNFKDEFGRFRVFHGVNVVYKTFPFYPDIKTFDPRFSLCDEDLTNLRNWGMNVIRLHVAWEGVQPQRGQYNFTYIQQLKKIVQKCAQYDISVILDAHQDLFNKKFCGQGFPDWAVNRSSSFPLPLRVKMDYDKDGYPTWESCHKVEFAEFYLTYDVMKFQQDFFTNKDGLADSFAKMWILVAKALSNQRNLLGYEILNEPIGANAYKNAYNVIGPGVSNNKFLLPFYKKITAAIRGVDQENLIFFEPSILDIFGGGFLGLPDTNRSRTVMSYHLYCPLVTPEGEPTKPSICQKFDDLTLESKFKNYRDLGVGGFLTEFGALSNTQKSADQVTRITSYVEKNMQSWTYWQFKYYNDLTTAARPASTESFYFEDGSLQMNKVKALTHPYAYAICGTQLSSTYTDNSFVFSYLSANCQAETEIYINEEFYFPDGTWRLNFQPECTKCHLEQISRGHYKIMIPDELKFSKITLTIAKPI